MSELKIDYSIFFETSLDLLAIVNRNGSVEQVNSAWSELTGYSKEELKDQDCMGLIVEHDRILFADLFSRVLLGEGITNKEIRIRKRNGSFLWVNCNASLTENHIFLVARDSTEIKQMNTMLQATQNIAILGGWSLDVDSFDIFWSEQSFLIFGIETTIRMDWQSSLSFFSQASRLILQDAIDDVIHRARSFDIKAEILTPSGSSKFIQVKAKLDRNEQGRKKVIGTFQDVTKETLLTQQLDEYRNRLGLALDCGGIGIWEWSIGSDQLYWDNKMYELYNLQGGVRNLQVSHWLEMIYEEDREITKEMMNEAIQTRADFRFEFRLQLENGSFKYLKVEGRVYFDSEDNPEKMVGANWDISEERIMEFKLRESEERYELAVYGSSVGIWDWNFRVNKMYWSEIFCRICGIPTKETMSARSFLSLVHPADKKRLRVIFREHLLQRCTLDIKFRLVDKKTLEEKWVRLKGQAVWNLDGKALRIAGSIEDITDIKKADDSYRKSLLQFQTLTELAPVGILLLDNDLHPTYINDKAFELLKIRKYFHNRFGVEELLVNFSKESSDLIHQHLKSDTLATTIECEINTEFNKEYSYVYIKPMLGDDGKAFGKMLILSDITQLIRFERELIQKENTIHAIFDNTVDAIITFDEEGFIHSGNKAVEVIFGTSSLGLQDRNISDLIDFNTGYTDSLKGETEYLEEFSKIKSNIRYEVQGKRSDSLFPCELSLSEIIAEDKLYYTAVLRDISERKKSEEELMNAMEEANRANKSKSLFLANMSHEIRTPLNSILGMADLLIETSLTFEQLRYVKNFKESGDSLLAIINDILDLSKVESGQLVIESIEFDLEYILDQVVDLHSVTAHEKGLEFFYDFKNELGNKIIGDPYRLKQILTNLLSNAMKFTKHGMVGLLIEKIDYDNKENLKFSVIDTGIGIDKDKLDHVFESFTQADSSTTRMFGGTGLGLNITKNLVEMMQGKILLESEIGKGSCFSFVLPLNLSSTALIKEPNPDLSQKRILVIENNESYLKFFKSKLENFGAKVDTSTEIHESFLQYSKAKMEGRDYSLVLIDQRLRDEDIFQAVKKFNKLKSINDRFLYLLNSNSNNSDLLRLKSLGISNYLTKPIKRRELVDSLSTIFSPNAEGKLLIVDDDIDILDILCLKLEKTRVSARQTMNPYEALKLLETESFDAIFIDYIMKGMNGIELAKTIRSRGINVPIIIGTSSNPQDFETEALSLGVNRILEKPYNYANLIQVIEEKVAEGILNRKLASKTINSDCNIGSLKILLVDDSEKNRNLIKFYLAKTPVNIVEAENGQDALSLFKKDVFDIVLMDMQMPIMDGYNSTKLIREYETELSKEGIPIVALTAFALKGEKEKSYDAGCNHHLTKPIKKKDLIDTIFNLTQHKRAS